MSDDKDTDFPFRLFLFGGPRLLKGGRPCPLSRDQGAFLGFLFGSKDEELEREEVISTFWPGIDPPVARHRLSQLIYAFRKKVGSPAPFVTVGDLILASEGMVSSDLQEFEAALEELRLSDCAQLLAHGFLHEMRGSGPPSLCSWIEGREREFRSRLEGEARRQLEDCTSKADWGGALRAAEVLSSLDPLKEETLRELMKARARVGRRAEAEDAFEEYAHRRKVAIGADFEPAEETRVLLRQIQSAEEIGPPDYTAGNPQGQREPLLVGRDAEHALLRRSVNEPPNGVFRGILVTGEAGIGKSRLIRESLLGLGIEGQEVFWADQAELEQQIPLNPLIEALRKPRVSDTLALLDDPWRAVLYGVMPGHFRGEGKIPQAPEIGPKSVPRRLFEAFDQIFLKLIQEGPVTLVLEDLQWADQTTLSVLEFLFRRWEQGNLQAVFSLRSEEIQRNSALRSFLETLRVHEDFLEIPLEDLSPLDSKTLIRDLSDHPLSEDEVAHLHSLAGGNPFFLIEMTLEYLTGRVNRPSVTDRALSIPISIRQVLERRLTQLSPAAETVLGVLAVHSRALPIEHLARVADLPTWQCMNGLDQLEGFRLVQSDGTEISALHELIRKTAYQSLTSSRRAWLHRRLGIHIQEFTEDPPPDELAIHFDHAGDGELALKFAREAAQKAEASGAIAEALKFLDIARDHSQAPEEVATLIQRMGRLNFLTQDHQKAAPLLEVAAQRLRLQGMTAEALSAEVDRVDSLGQSGLLPLRERMEELERIKKEARDNGHWEIFMKALDVEAHQEEISGNLEGVQRVLSQAEESAQNGGSEAQCRAMTLLASKAYFGSPTEGLEAARKAVALGQKLEREDLLLKALSRLIISLQYQGALNLKEGQQALAEAEKRLGTCGDLSLKFYIRLNLGVWHLETGELGRAASVFSTASKVIRGSKLKKPHVMLNLNLGEMNLDEHETGAAFKRFSSAKAHLSQALPKFFHEMVCAGLGLCALHDGNLQEARARESDLSPDPKCWSYDPVLVTVFRARMMLRRGDPEGAIAHLREVGGAIRDRFVPTWIRLVLEEGRVRRRFPGPSDKKLIKEALRVSERFKLRQRTRELHLLLQDTRAD